MTEMKVQRFSGSYVKRKVKSDLGLLRRLTKGEINLEEEYIKPWLLKDIALHTYHKLSTRETGEVIGFCFGELFKTDPFHIVCPEVRKHKTSFYVQLLFVTPEHRNKGFGSSFVKSLIENDDYGITVVPLKNAKPFWKKNGLIDEFSIFLRTP